MAERVDRIAGRPVEWAWEERVPRGEVTLIAGRDGAGKSTFAGWLTAQWTRGHLNSGKPESVYVLSAEERPDRITRPRLEVMGADLERVHVEKDAASRFAFPGSREQLGYEVSKHQGRGGIVVIDPADSFIRDASRARAGIDDVKMLAEDLDVAVLLLHHFNKRIDPTDLNASIGGGRGFAAAVRSRFVWGEIAHGKVKCQFPDAKRLYALLHFKNSYAELQEPLVFEAAMVPNPYDANHPLPVLRDQGSWTVTPMDLFPTNEVVRESKTEKARTMIRDLLAVRGEMLARELQEKVVSSEISQRTFENARSQLVKDGWIISEKRGAEWWWRIAQAPDTPEDASS